MPRGFDGTTPFASNTIMAWLDQSHYQSIKPFKNNTNPYLPPHIETLASRLTPLPGTCTNARALC